MATSTVECCGRRRNFCSLTVLKLIIKSCSMQFNHWIAPHRLVFVSLPFAFTFYFRNHKASKSEASLVSQNPRQHSKMREVQFPLWAALVYFDALFSFTTRRSMRKRNQKTAAIERFVIFLTTLRARCGFECIEKQKEKSVMMKLLRFVFMFLCFAKDFKLLRRLALSGDVFKFYGWQLKITVKGRWKKGSATPATTERKREREASRKWGNKAGNSVVKILFSLNESNLKRCPHFRNLLNFIAPLRVASRASISWNKTNFCAAIFTKSARNFISLNAPRNCVNWQAFSAFFFRPLRPFNWVCFASRVVFLSSRPK